MQIIIKATDEIFSTWTSKFKVGEHDFIQYHSTTASLPEGDLFIDTCFEEEGPAFLSVTSAMVLVNAVITPTITMPENFARYNGWRGFFDQPKLEIAGNAYAINKIIEHLTKAGIETVVSPDEIGMISPRVVSMIINEAYFALAENISSKEEINTAMKLGTNYPYGPFEWCELIGFQKVSTLLQSLAKTNERYSLAPAFQII
ncbi:3-hydroxyacyl-CoA dehydrogenase family protein [Sediminibacterium sp.]|uniref:3-hydroxyacyl-CoA dehydrogenase family protein n=1 Tax=Sediminibacterium sp. TaxID=1917865 RepID=UPI003F721015